jgi:hypothetical protein
MTYDKKYNQMKKIVWTSFFAVQTLVIIAYIAIHLPK